MVWMVEEAKSKAGGREFEPHKPCMRLQGGSNFFFRSIRCAQLVPIFTTGTKWLPHIRNTVPVHITGTNGGY